MMTIKTPPNSPKPPNMRHSDMTRSRMSENKVRFLKRLFYLWLLMVFLAPCKDTKDK